MIGAVILAAGRGSRLGETTAEKPKCLVELCGISLLQWQVAALRWAGIESIALVTGYRREVLQPWCSSLRLHEFHNPDWATTTMVSTLAAAAEWLEKGPCLVSYSDIVYHPRIVTALMQAQSDLAVTLDRQWHSLWSLRFADPLEDAEVCRLSEDGKLARIGGRAASLAEIEAQYMGLLRFTPAGWAAFAREAQSVAPGKLDMTGLLGSLIGKGLPVQGVPVEAGWCEVDNAVDLASYQAALEKGEFSHDWRGLWSSGLQA